MDNILKTETIGLIRDGKTGALLNTNNMEFEQIKLNRARHKMISSLQQEVISVKSEIDEVKRELIEIRSLLKQYFDKNLNESVYGTNNN